MTFRFLGFATAVVLALGVLHPGPTSASPMTATPAIIDGAASGLGPTQIQFYGDNYGGRYYRPGNYWHGGPRWHGGARWHGGSRWYGGPSIGFSFQVGPRFGSRYYYGSPYRYRAACWQVRSVWSPYGYRYRRVWVCD